MTTTSSLDLTVALTAMAKECGMVERTKTGSVCMDVGTFNPDCEPACGHKSLPVPDFDNDEVARLSLSAEEVRERYPRIQSKCADCGQVITVYKNAIHFLTGEWWDLVDTTKPRQP